MVTMTKRKTFRVVEGRFLGLMLGTLLLFVWRSEENHRKFQSEWPVPGMRFEPVIFRM